MNDITLINDAIKKHRELSDYYDAMGCKDDVLVQERYIGWLSELREYKANDAELVKHARWSEQAIRPTNRGVDEIGYYCSECGYFENYLAKYCAGCGAKMEGGVENDL